MHQRSYTRKRCITQTQPVSASSETWPMPWIKWIKKDTLLFQVASTLHHPMGQGYATPRPMVSGQGKAIPPHLHQR